MALNADNRIADLKRQMKDLKRKEIPSRVDHKRATTSSMPSDKLKHYQSVCHRRPKENLY